MTTSYLFENERLKPIIASYINSNFDFEAIPLNLRKHMRLSVQENIATFWVNDGFHFLEAQFTKDAINEFRKSYSHIKFQSLKGGIMFISKWSLKIKECDSRKVYTSYQNMQIQLVIESFKPLLHEKPVRHQLVNAINIFHDEDVQIYIRHKRHEFIKEILNTHIYKSQELKGRDFAMPSIKAIKGSEKQYTFLDSMSDKEMMMDVDQREDPKVHNDELLEELVNVICESEVLRCQINDVTRQELIEDNFDFREIKEKYNFGLQSTNGILKHDSNTALGTAASSQVSRFTSNDADDNSNIADIKRILIQEIGEDDFNYLYQKKSKLIMKTINDGIERQMVQQNLEFYSKEQSRNNYKLFVANQIAEKKKKQEQKKKKTKLQGYKLGFTADQIKERIMRFMVTFNQNQDDEDQILETRPRAFSQENIRGDQSEMLETKSMMSQGFALSQFNYKKNFFKDDETESEREEDMTMNVDQHQNTVIVLSQIKPTMKLFQEYIDWFKQNETTTQFKFDLLQETQKREQEILQQQELERQRIIQKQEQEQSIARARSQSRQIENQKKMEERQRREEEARKKEEERKAILSKNKEDRLAQRNKRALVSDSESDKDEEMIEEEQQDKIQSFKAAKQITTAQVIVKSNTQSQESQVSQQSIKLITQDIKLPQIVNPPTEHKPSQQSPLSLKSQSESDSDDFENEKLSKIIAATNLFQKITPAPVTQKLDIKQSLDKIAEQKQNQLFQEDSEMVEEQVHEEEFPIDERLNNLDYILGNQVVQETKKEVIIVHSETEQEEEDEESFQDKTHAQNNQQPSDYEEEEEQLEEQQMFNIQVEQEIPMSPTLGYQEEEEEEEIILEERKPETPTHQVEICTFNEVPQETRSQENLFGQQDLQDNSASKASFIESANLTQINEDQIIEIKHIQHEIQKLVEIQQDQLASPIKFYQEPVEEKEIAKEDVQVGFVPFQRLSQQQQQIQMNSPVKESSQEVQMERHQFNTPEMENFAMMYPQYYYPQAAANYMMNQQQMQQNNLSAQTPVRQEITHQTQQTTSQINSQSQTKLLASSQQQIQTHQEIMSDTSVDINKQAQLQHQIVNQKWIITESSRNKKDKKSKKKHSHKKIIKKLYTHDAYSDDEVDADDEDETSQDEKLKKRQQKEKSKANQQMQNQFNANQNIGGLTSMAQIAAHVEIPSHIRPQQQQHMNQQYAQHNIVPQQQLPSAQNFLQPPMNPALMNNGPYPMPQMNPNGQFHPHFNPYNFQQYQLQMNQMMQQQMNQQVPHPMNLAPQVLPQPKPQAMNNQAQQQLQQQQQAAQNVQLPSISQVVQQKQVPQSIQQAQSQSNNMKFSIPVQQQPTMKTVAAAPPSNLNSFLDSIPNSDNLSPEQSMELIKQLKELQYLTQLSQANKRIKK